MAKNIAIIGGGPAGFMAAISAAENATEKCDIDIFEKNDPLKTLLYTGGGRCNLTNAIYDYKELASNYPRGEKFLYSAFSKFSVKETNDFFISRGVALYAQEDGRVFPISNDANEVRYLFLNEAKRLGIHVESKFPVKEVSFKNGKFILNLEKSKPLYDKVIIATGGDYKNPNSSGYKFAKNFGHKITKLRPALTALVTRETWPVSLAGVTIKNAKANVFFKDKLVASTNGDFVFTHSGISGPLAYKVSSYCAFLDYDECSPIVIKINFAPGKSKEEFDSELLEEFEVNSKKSIVNILNKYAPKSVITEILSLNMIDPEKKASQVTKTERKVILDSFTETQLAVKSPAMEGEIVTAGGVDLNEVDSKTMESKLQKGLYFCGEVLNIDGLTGGFNLQACWSTGFIAGINATKIP